MTQQKSSKRDGIFAALVLAGPIYAVLIWATVTQEIRRMDNQRHPTLVQEQAKKIMSYEWVVVDAGDTASGEGYVLSLYQPISRTVMQMAVDVYDPANCDLRRLKAGQTIHFVWQPKPKSFKHWQRPSAYLKPIVI